jgi:hypothetical protein
VNFVLALHLHHQGHEVVVVTLEPLSELAVRWHQALDVLTFTTFDAVAERRFDLAIATWWKTIYELARIDAGHYLYFVQSIESWFYADTDAAVRNLVNATYLLPLPGITEARWIKAHLAERFGHDYHLVLNGCAKAIYGEEGTVRAPRVPGRLRVLVEGPLGVDFKNVARTIALVRRSRAEEIWLLTSSKAASYPGVDRVFSQLPAAECPSIYRSCDVLVKLSLIEGMFGPPLEMFHCGGTAIVYDVTGHDEYIASGDNALVVASGDETAVIAAINRLHDDPELLAALKQGARRTAAAWPDWADTAPGFLAALEAINAQAPAVSRQQIALTTAEFFRQYVRAETALQAARTGGSRPVRLFRRVESLVRRGLGRVTRSLLARSRLFFRLHARLVEERQQPMPRTRI